MNEFVELFEQIAILYRLEPLNDPILSLRNKAANYQLMLDSEVIGSSRIRQAFLSDISFLNMLVNDMEKVVTRKG